MIAKSYFPFSGSLIVSSSVSTKKVQKESHPHHWKVQEPDYNNMARRSPLFYFTPLVLGFIAFHAIPLFKPNNTIGDHKTAHERAINNDEDQGKK